VGHHHPPAYSRGERTRLVRAVQCYGCRLVRATAATGQYYRRAHGVDSLPPSHPTTINSCGRSTTLRAGHYTWTFKLLLPMFGGWTLVAPLPHTGRSTLEVRAASPPEHLACMLGDDGRTFANAIMGGEHRRSAVGNLGPSGMDELNSTFVGYLHLPPHLPTPPLFRAPYRTTTVHCTSCAC